MRSIFVLALLCINLIAQATNYYVKNTGNDSNTGLSDAQAWRTIAKVNATSFSPGDAIFFNKGDTWREQLKVPSSGTSASYIVFSSYGTGANPVIIGSNIATWDNQGGNIWKSHTTFTNPRTTDNVDLYFNSSGTIKWGLYKASTSLLTGEYNWTWSGNYIYVYAASDPGVRYTTVEVPQRISCINLNNRDYLLFNGIDLHYATYGYGNGVTPETKHTGLVIENSKISYFGGNITSATYEAGYGIKAVYSDMTINDNEISECGRRAVDLHIYGSGFTLKNILVEDNTIHDCYHTTGVDMSVGSSGYYTGSINGVTIRRNLMYNTSNRSGYLSEGMFIQNSNSGAAGALIKNIHVYSNIFKYPDNSSIHIEHGDSVFIYNNTFYEVNSTKTTNCFMINIDYAATHIKIKNNIFYTASTYNYSGLPLYINTNSSASEVQADYNIYYRANNSVAVIKAGGTNYYMNQIATVRSALGWETHGQFINPSLTGSADYHPMAGSPAIGSGTVISEVTTDFESNTCGNPANIGCYATPVASPPLSYVSSAVANATPSLLEMTYNLTLANIVPATSSFAVVVNSVARSVNSVTISGTKVQLTLANAVVYGDVVTVAYTKPATNPLQTASGGQAASISAKNVTNNVSAACPLYVSSAIANATPSLLEMTYNLTLANIVPATSSFTVVVNSVARSVNSITISGTKVQLTLASAVVYGDVVTVAYPKPATNPLQTPSGGQAASISAQNVTNNVNAPAPVYVSSDIANATPSLLEMTYNLTLANIEPAAASFTVIVNSVARSINSVTISGTKVQLTLASAVVYGDVVTVAYTKPATNPLQTPSGGQATTISAQNVTNNVSQNVIAGSNYYVKNTGNDSNTGLSDAQAWRTIAKVNATSFSPGDAIFFNKGDTWREQLKVPSSGTSASYIVFSSYGTGANPVIIGSNIATWDNQGGNIWKSHTTFTNPRTTDNVDLYFNSSGTIKWGLYKASTSLLTGEYNWTWSGNYIYVYAASDPGVRYTTVEVPQRISCINLNNRDYLLFNGIDLHYATYGYGNGVTPETKHTGLVIENSKISYFGGNITSATYEAGYGIKAVYSDMTINDNEISECGRRAVDLHIYGSGFTLKNILVEDNTIHDCYHTTGVDMSVGSSGYYTGSINGVTIRRNLMYNTSNRSGYLSEGMFIQNSNSGAAGALIKNIHVYSNIFKYPDNSSIHIEHGDSVFIYNNTFYEVNTTKTTNCFMINIDYAATHIKIKNNIFYTASTYNYSGLPLYINTNSSVSEVQADYNIYYRANNSVAVIKAGGTNYYMNQIATVRSALGWETHGQFINPSLTGSADYHPLAGSPAIGSGTVISEVTTDFESNTCGNPANIGCYATPAGSGLALKSSPIDSTSLLLPEMAFETGKTETFSDSPGGGKITVYPNPASSYINVSFSEPLLLDQIIRIYNLSGAIVFEEKLGSGDRDIQIPINLRPGIYIVQVGSGKLVLYAQKLVVGN